MSMELQRAGAVLRAAAMYAEVLGEPNLPVSELMNVVKALRDDCEALMGTVKP